jgi:hypothetical protein
MEIVGIFYDHFEYFMGILYNLCPLGWYVWTKKNLANQDKTSASKFGTIKVLHKLITLTLSNLQNHLSRS